MDGLRPGLDPNLLVVFQSLFSTPLSLQAAFDDEAECCILLESVFPDMVEADVRNVAAELMVWQSENAPSFKRLRLGTVSQNLCKLPPQHVRDIQTSFTSLTQSSTVTVLELAAKKRQRKYKDEHPDARARKLDTERQRYTVLLSNVIKSAKLPVVHLVNTLDDPFTAWSHLFAARRANTLKNRYKAWRPFEAWLEFHRSRT